ncbi:hypothetical protein D3C76_1670780 [compost metagenome]
MTDFRGVQRPFLSEEIGQDPCGLDEFHSLGRGNGGQAGKFGLRPGQDRDFLE